MTSIITKLIDSPVAAFRAPGSSLCSAGLPGAAALVNLPVSERSERLVQASAAATAQAQAYAPAANGVGCPKQETRATEHHTMWAFRGLPPWRDPA